MMQLNEAITGMTESSGANCFSHGEKEDQNASRTEERGEKN